MEIYNKCNITRLKMHNNIYKIKNEYKNKENNQQTKYKSKIM